MTKTNNPIFKGRQLNLEVERSSVERSRRKNIRSLDRFGSINIVSFAIRIEVSHYIYKYVFSNFEVLHEIEKNCL